MGGKVEDAHLIFLHTTDGRVAELYLDDVNKNTVISNFENLDSKLKEARPEVKHPVDFHIESMAGT